MAQFGYGDDLVLGSGGLGADSLILKQWSPEVLRYGKDQLVFANFLETRVELGRGKGDTIYVPIFGEMAALGTTALVEGTSVPFGTFDTDSVSITITEYGRALARPMSEDYFSNIELQQQLLMTLGWNFARSWDAKVKASVYDSAAHCFYVAAAGSYVYGSNFTTGTDFHMGAGTLYDAMVDAVYDKLRINKVPRFADGYYRWITNVNGARDVKHLSGFESLQVYSNFIQPSGLIAQEIGRYKGFVFIETQENMGTACVSYAFGRNIGAQAFGLPMEVRYEPDYKQDFQRTQAFAWYLIGGAGVALANKGTHLLVIRHGTGS